MIVPRGMDEVLTRASSAFLVAAMASCPAITPSPAHAAGVVVTIAVPDSARLAGLRRAVAEAPVLRVVGESGRERIPDPILDSSGVRSATWVPVASRRPALFTTERTAPVAARPPIPWSRISALETGRPKALQGAVGGTVIGFVLGAGIALAVLPRGYVSESEGLRSIGIVSGATIAGTLVGTLIGSQRGFRPIYRADSGLEAARTTFLPPRAPRRATKLAAGLGAALAWDLADLPRHHARLPEPVGGFTAGAAFAGGALSTARGDGSESAIDVLIGRWNTLYPPYALEGMDDH
jgi:hypothetical protein